MRAVLEICVDTAAGLACAKAAGADRVELCSALGLGGLTPSYGLMCRAGDNVFTMIRPRAGDFIWSADEVGSMIADIGIARDLGLSGVVIGAMDRARRLDLPVLRRLVTAARGMDITLHRVVDLLDDPVTAVEIAADLGINRILTSGGALHAIDGIAVLAKMVARGGVSIMAGAGLRVEDIAPLAAVGIREFHASASRCVAEDARLTKLGFAPSERRETDLGIVAALKAAVAAVS
jgi:copper homeostasis protein